jgi:ABC-type transporter Mla subunit MlaD
MVGHGAQPSPVDADLVVAWLDRLLAHLRVAEAGLKNLSRESLVALAESLDSAMSEVRAFQAEVRSAGWRRLRQERLQGRIAELKTLSRRVQVLLDAAKSFHAALFRIHHTEQHGYGGLVNVPGARNYVAVPHRLEIRG